MKKQFLIGLAFILCLTSSCDKEDEPAPAVIEVEDFTKTIDENPANGFVLGTLKASTDKGTLTFKLVNESVAGAFDLNTNTGELKVKDGAKFNYQSNDKLTAKVSVVNGKVEKSINVTITLIALPIIEVENFQLTIDIAKTGFVLGILKAKTNTGTLTYKLKSESIAGAFDLDTKTGELKVKDGSQFNFQVNDNIKANVSVINGTVEKFIDVVITLTIKPNTFVLDNTSEIEFFELNDANLYWGRVNKDFTNTHERHELIITDGEFKGINYIGNDAVDFPNGYNYKIILFVYPKKGTNYNIENDFAVSKISTINQADKWNVGLVLKSNIPPNKSFSQSTNTFSGIPKILFNYTLDNDGKFNSTGPLSIYIPLCVGNSSDKISMKFTGQYKRIFDN